MADEGQEEQQQSGDGGPPGGGGYSGGDVVSGGAIITYSQPYDLSANRTGDVWYLGWTSDDSGTDGYYLLEFSRNGDFSSPSYSAYAGTWIGFNSNNPPPNNGGGAWGAENWFEITDGSNIYSANDTPLQQVQFNETWYWRVKRNSNTQHRYGSDWSSPAEFYIVPIIYVQGRGDGTVFPFWDNQFTITGNDSFNSLFRFRKDTRDWMLDTISTKVRELWQQHLNSAFNFYEGNPSNEDIIAAWNPSLFSSSERTRLIDGMITEVMYNTEQMLNVMGDNYVQSLYGQIYSRLQNVRTYLNDLVTQTVSASYKNLKRSQELVNVLQQKVDEENIHEHTIYVNSNNIIPNIDAKLFRTNSRISYDVSDRIIMQNNELVIDFMSLSSITNMSNRSNFFQPWYIKLSPKPLGDISISSHNNSLISFITNIPLGIEDVLGGHLLDNDNNQYKIINKINDQLWLLDKIPQNINQITKFVPNYFEEQLIQLNFAWQHNYIPKLIPANISLPPLLEPYRPIIEEPVEPSQPATSDVITGIIPEVNKEIW